MKRIQRVEQYLSQWTAEQFDMENWHSHRPQGCTADLAGSVLGIDRSNASRDLNLLVAAQKAIKIGGKPVLFLSREAVRSKLGSRVPIQQTYASWDDFFQSFQSEQGVTIHDLEARREIPSTTAFDLLIGRHRSLKKPIELAKAAILYPPHGLHTLLTGPTGAGKTMFADSMYQFAVEMGQLQPNAPYISFNCADYAHNPQLLLAQLFGVEKGAYTGADRDRSGIVEKADNGIIFLDEVHRLPPEGQEMLFQLLDKGIFRRLGETEIHRKANIRLIAATTENPKSSLLMTFVRRIPMIIPIPSIAERSLEERFQLLQHFFSEESARVQRPFQIVPEVLKALLLFDCPGNVGQLKSEIQLLSARSFVTQIHDAKANRLEVTLEHASDQVRQGLLQIPEKRKELDRLLENWTGGMNLNGADAEINRPTGESLYEILERQAFELRKRGLNEEEINHVLSVDIEVYFRKFLENVSNQFASRRQDIIRIVGEPLMGIAEEMFDLAACKLDRIFPSQTVFGAALHLRAALDRLKAGHAIPNPGLATIRKQAQAEYETGREMAQLFQRKTGLALPDNEIGFLATILLSVLEQTPSPKVGVLVIAHGSSTASSMLEVVQQLLAVSHGVAIDMRMDMDPDWVLEQAIMTARSIDEGKGILLLVDMGSLVTFGEIIRERTQIPVRTIPNVSTFVLLEAVRKATVSSSTLDSVYESVMQGGLLFSPAKDAYSPLRTGVLPVVCVTGEGSAVQIKSVLEEQLKVPDDFELQIVPVSISSFEETPDRLAKWLGGRKPLAIAGTLNPQVEDVPFVSAQEILMGDGIRRISHMIDAFLTPRELPAAVPTTVSAAVSAAASAAESTAPTVTVPTAVPTVRSEPDAAWDALMQTLRGTVKRINPYYAVPAIAQAIEQIAERLPVDHDLDTRIGVTMHLVLAIEKRLETGKWPSERANGQGFAQDFTQDLQDSQLEQRADLITIREIMNRTVADWGIEIPYSESVNLARLLGGVPSVA